MLGNNEEVTSFRCNTQNVALRRRKNSAPPCVLGSILKLPGLYDAVLRAAAVWFAKRGYDYFR